MKNRINHFIASFGYVGKFPIAPGTMGTIAGLLLIIGINRFFPWTYHYIMLALILMSIVTSEITAQYLDEPDPSEIVIDEVIGIFVSFVNIPITLKTVIIGFILFRLLDIFKPFGINNMQGLHGGIGIVADDFLAGLYTNLFLLLLIHFIII